MIDSSQQALIASIEAGLGGDHPQSIDDRAWICGEATLLTSAGAAIDFNSAKVGLELLTCSVFTGEIKGSKIVDIQTRENAPTWLLYLRGHYGDISPNVLTLEVAATLPVFVPEKGWTRLLDLRPGDRVLSFDCWSRCTTHPDQADVLQNRELTVLGVSKTGRNKRVFSLKLADTYSYCIGQVSVWVCDGISLHLGKTPESMTMPSKEDVFSVGGCANQQYFQGANGEIWETDHIQPGFQLNSRAETTGELVPATVRYRILHEDINRCCIWYSCDGDERNVTVSFGQEILVKGRGWTRAIDLKQGDLFESGPGKETIVSLIQTDWDGDPMDGDCYSFVVSGDNTFCFGIESELCFRGVSLKP